MAEKNNTEKNNKPAATVRQGNLKVVLWKNEGEKGSWYTADLVWTFKTEAGFQGNRSRLKIGRALC